MKKIILLLFVAAFIACNNESKIDYAIVTGKIDNLDKSTIKLYSRYTEDVVKEIESDENGNFIDTIRIENNNIFMLTSDRNFTEIYLEVGDSLNINYNAKDYKNSIEVSGTAVGIYDYLIAKKEKATEVLGKGADIYKKEETAYKEAHQNLKKAQEDLLFNAEGISESYKAKEMRNINYEYLVNLNKYELYHGYYTKNRNFKVSEGFVEGLEKFDYENENDFIFSQSYRSLVDANITKKVQEAFKKDSTLVSDIEMLKETSKIENQTIKNKLLYDQARYGITYTDNLEDFYTIYKANSTDEANNKSIEESYQGIMKLAKGNPSPKFKDYENYAGGTKSLEDLKGDYVYIDVWATWCGPCLAEIPSLKKVEKQFHDEDIQFLSISIDNKKDHDKWMKMIGEKELGGMQLFADNAWESQFIQDYMIKGIPRFILLDKEGNIIDANAPRPSNKKLVTLLNSLDGGSKGDLKL